MTDALDAMIAEAGGPVADAGPVAAEPVAAAVPALPDYVRAVTRPLVDVVGTIACDAAAVTPLDAGEVDALADAVNNLLRFYLTVDGLDEKTAAWLALGAVGLGVVKNRRRIAPKGVVIDGGGEAPPVDDGAIVAAQMAAMDEWAGGGDAAAGA